MGLIAEDDSAGARTIAALADRSPTARAWLEPPPPPGGVSPATEELLTVLGVLLYDQDREVDLAAFERWLAEHPEVEHELPPWLYIELLACDYETRWPVCDLVRGFVRRDRGGFADAIGALHLDPPYVRLGNLARRSVEAHLAGETEAVAEVLGAVEALLEEDEATFGDPLAVGYLEGLQNHGDRAGLTLDAMESGFPMGPRSRGEWGRLREFWEGD